MAHYIAVIHKDTNSCYGVSFPDVPGVTTAGDTIDEAIRNASDVLSFALEDWAEQTGSEFPAPRTIDDLRLDPALAETMVDAVVAVIPLQPKVDVAA